MNTPEVLLHHSHAQELPSDVSRDLFQGLDKISENEGRIYKKVDTNGRIEFFKAKDFWSSVYHFFCSARMVESDLRALNNRVTLCINESNDLNLNAKVESTFISVLRKVNTNTTWFFPRDDALNQLLTSPHLTLIENATKKIVNESPITFEELFLLEELRKTPESFRGQSFTFHVVSEGLKKIDNRLKAELLKEELRKEHGFAISDMSPINFSEWQDIPLSHLYIPRDTQVFFYDLSPGKESDLSCFERVFKGDFMSPVTRVRYPLKAWFDFIKICKKNNNNVNPIDYLNSAFKAMKENCIAAHKKNETYTAEHEVYSTSDWDSFISICNINDMAFDSKELETIFISITMEKLINNIIAKEIKEYNSNLIKPYLEILECPTVQNLILPDIGMTVADAIMDVFQQNMHSAAVHLWNALKNKKIITTAPSEKLIKSAEILHIHVQK